MSWYALENLDEAMEETKELILPFDFMTWTKLAIIALLAGGIGMPNMPSAPMQSPGQTDNVYTPDSGTSSFDSSMADPFSGIDSMGGMTGMATGGAMSGAIVGIVVVLILFIGLFMYISSVFQFIYYQTVLDKKPAITENFSKHAYRGLRYFGFQIAFTIYILLTLAIPAAGFAVNEILGFIMFILVWIPLAIISVIISGLVHDFVLLRMMESDEGLIQAWRSIWPDIRSGWKQILVYLIIKAFVGIAIGLMTLIIALVLLIALLIPFGIVGFLASMVHSALLGAVIVLGVLTFTVIMLYVQVPFSTFIYAYITLVYHDLTS
jgi:hypothetical protein